MKESPQEFVEITNRVGEVIDGHSSGVIAASLCTVLAMVVKESGIPPGHVIEMLAIMIGEGGEDETAH
jgi:hypothetical protein